MPQLRLGPLAIASLTMDMFNTAMMDTPPENFNWGSIDDFNFGDDNWILAHYEKQRQAFHDGDIGSVAPTSSNDFPPIFQANRKLFFSLVM